MSKKSRSPNRRSTSPPKLKPGDRVRFVSPASTPDRDGILKRAKVLESWGLTVDFGDHAFHKLAYLAGTDEERLSDFNEALRNPEIRAIFATRGGKGSYRIADQLDFDAARYDPKPVIGFSDITAIHLSLAKQCQLATVHGTLMEDEKRQLCTAGAEFLRKILMTNEDVVIHARADEDTAELTTTGTANGQLIGGNLHMIATVAGWALPNLRSKILLIEATNMFIGQVDRILTMLRKSGALDGLAGVAIGRFTDFSDEGAWQITDLLRQHLEPMRIPLLGGLPLGHGPSPLSVPLGTRAILDTAAKTLTVESISNS